MLCLQACLMRALDHAPTCPFCRAALSPVARYEENQALKCLLEQTQAEATLARQHEVEAAEAEANSAMPIFVCMTVSLDGEIDET